jgi:predicted permease
MDDGRGWRGSSEQVMRDLRFGVRALRRSPAAAVVAVLSVALGIGANTAIFSMLYAIAWRPLPVANPETLVQLQALEPGTGKEIDLPAPVLRGLREERQVFAGVAFDSSDGLAGRIGDRTERVIGEVVTADFFAVLGVPLFLGTSFSENTDGAAWEASAILSYDFFSNRLNADAGIVGQSIILNGYPFRIIGISPPGFSGLNVGESPDVRLPMMLEPGMQARRMPALKLLDQSTRGFGRALARLQPGVNRAQAEAATQLALRRLWPAVGRPGEAPPVVRLVEGSRGRLAAPRWIQRVLAATLGGTGLLLLIACLNVANIFLARAAARRREFGVRLAIGASPSVLIRQILTESVLVVGAAAMLGLLVARWGSQLLLTWLPQSSTPIALALEPDARVLVFAAAATLLTGLLFGIAPALQASRVDVLVSMRADGGSARTGGGPGWGSRASVVTQVALTLVLLAGAGLLVRTVQGIQAADPGHDGRRVLLFSMKPVRDGNVRYTDAEVRGLLRDLVQRAAALPGVEAASLIGSGEASAVPGTTVWRGGQTIVHIERDAAIPVEAFTDEVSPSYFQMFDLPVLAGRTFTDADERAPKVVVVTDALARDLFGAATPVGRRVRFGAGREATEYEIAGVVSGRRFDSPRRPATRAYFLPLGQERVPVMPTLAVKIRSADVAAAIRDIRRLCQEVDPNLPVFNIRSAATQRDRALAQERLAALLFMAFGGLALLLAAIGLYGVIACDVARRIPEIAVRLAIGAERRSLIRMVMTDSLRLVVAGVVLGLPLAYAGTQLAANALRLPSDDTVVFPGTVVVILIVGVLAGWLPARRAARVDPVSVLRAQ